MKCEKFTKSDFFPDSRPIKKLQEKLEPNGTTPGPSAFRTKETQLYPTRIGKNNLTPRNARLRLNRRSMKRFDSSTKKDTMSKQEPGRLLGNHKPHRMSLGRTFNCFLFCSNDVPTLPFFFFNHR